MEKEEIVEEINDGDLYLRKITLDDAYFFYNSLNDDKMTENLSLGPLLSLTYSKQLIKDQLKFWEKRLQFNYIIEQREDNRNNKLGSISLWNFNWQHFRAEIGVWLVPMYWKRGFGTKAVELIKNIGLFHLQLHRLEAHAAVENLRSIGLFKKCGFIEEGRLKDYLNFRGTFHDAVVLACIFKR